MQNLIVYRRWIVFDADEICIAQLHALKDVVDPGSFLRERSVEVAVASTVRAICKPRRIGNRSHGTRYEEFYDRESSPIRRVTLIRGF